MARRRRAEIRLSVASLVLIAISYLASSIVIYSFYSIFQNEVASLGGSVTSLHQALFQLNFTVLFAFFLIFVMLALALSPMFMLASSIVKLRTHRSPGWRMAGLLFLVSFTFFYGMIFKRDMPGIYLILAGFIVIIAILSLTRKKYGSSTGAAFLGVGGGEMFLLFSLQEGYIHFNPSYASSNSFLFILEVTAVMLIILFGASIGIAVGSSRIVGKRSREGESEESEQILDSIFLVGFSGGGKTVFSSLLLFFAPHVTGIPGYSYVVEETNPAIIGSLTQLLSGNWPENTRVQESRTGTSVVIQRSTRFGVKRVQMEINDMSGELWRDLSGATDVFGVLTSYSAQNPNIMGLPEATGYMITIEASESENWGYKQLEYLDLFRIIYAVNGSRLMDKKVAIIFTKCDMLGEPLNSYSPEQLFRDGFPSLYSYLKEHFSIESAVFLKSGLKVDDNGNPQVFIQNGKKTLVMDGAAPHGPFDDLIRWALK